MKSKNKLRVILKNGADFVIECDTADFKLNDFGAVIEYAFTGVTQNKPIHLDFSDVAAVIQLLPEMEAAEDGN